MRPTQITSPRKINFARSSGQSMTESTLAIALVGVISIGVLTALSQNFGSGAQDLFSVLYGTNTPRPSAPGSPTDPDGGTGPTLPETPPVGGETRDLTYPPVDSYGFTSPVEFTLSNGQVISLPNYPTDISDAIETAGANGTTEMLLANLEALISQLQESGELDENQANLLTNLANQGHQIAEYERMILEEGPDISAGDRVFYVDNGAGGTTEYSMSQFIEYLNFSGATDTTDIASLTTQMQYLMGNAGRSTGGMGDQARGLLSEYHNASAAGGMNNPAVKAIVNDLMINIAVLADQTRTSVLQNTYQVPYTGILRSGLTVTRMVDTYATPDANTSIVSATSHMASGGICNAGGGHDTGVRCPG